MSITIYHGPPGSYKTSSAVWREVVPAAERGRVVVTNIRGLHEQSFRDGYQRQFGKDLPDSFRIISLDTDRREERERAARWFHWAPKGALLVFDEAGRVFNPDWRVADLKALDLDARTLQEQEALPESERRPETHEIAFDMHRHHNWDIVLTTPNIKKVRTEIREAAEADILHANMALIGISKYFKTTHSNGTVKAFQRIPAWVFTLYDSTATGSVNDTNAGLPIWKNPKIVALVVFVVSLLAFLSTRPVPKVLGGQVVAATPTPSASGQVAAASAGVSAGRVLPGESYSKVNPDDISDYVIVGSLESRSRKVYFLRREEGTGHQEVTSTELESHGYIFVEHAPCNVEMVRGYQRQRVLCTLGYAFEPRIQASR